MDQRVTFYSNLQQQEKERFESSIIRFLNQVSIVGVKTEIGIEDKLLVASSAIIPVFGFPQWEYVFLDEVIVYPELFNHNFQLGAEDSLISGMVGSGHMEGKMILSKKSLHHGFSNSRDKKNVGIHEFIHLIDKQDGVIDGVPSVLWDHTSSIPWLTLINEKIHKIRNTSSDINTYGGTNQQEFVSVAGEYFFERPHLLKKKHPKLFQALKMVFQQDPTEIIHSKFATKETLSRNALCPCNSGKKFKRCCLGT